MFFEHFRCSAERHCFQKDEKSRKSPLKKKGGNDFKTEIEMWEKKTKAFDLPLETSPAFFQCQHWPARHTFPSKAVGERERLSINCFGGWGNMPLCRLLQRRERASAQNPQPWPFSLRRLHLGWRQLCLARCESSGIRKGGIPEQKWQQEAWDVKLGSRQSIATSWCCHQYIVPGSFAGIQWNRRHARSTQGAKWAAAKK